MTSADKAADEAWIKANFPDVPDRYDAVYEQFGKPTDFCEEVKQELYAFGLSENTVHKLEWLARQYTFHHPTPPRETEKNKYERSHAIPVQNVLDEPGAPLSEKLRLVQEHSTALHSLYSHFDFACLGSAVQCELLDAGLTMSELEALKRLLGALDLLLPRVAAAASQALQHQPKRRRPRHSDEYTLAYRMLRVLQEDGLKLRGRGKCGSKIIRVVFGAVGLHISEENARRYERVALKRLPTPPIQSG